MARLRFALVMLALAGVLAPAAGANGQTKSYAPQAVALVREYLGAIKRGDLKTACRIFSVPGVCAAGADGARIEHFRVFPAQPTMDGVLVPATIDMQPALFELSLSRGRYRIDDVVADPTPPVPAALGTP